MKWKAYGPHNRKPPCPWLWLRATMMLAPTLEPCSVKVLCTKTKEKETQVLDSKMWATIIIQRSSNILCVLRLEYEKRLRMDEELDGCFCRWMDGWGTTTRKRMNETRRLNPTVFSVCERTECGPRGRTLLHRGHGDYYGRGYGGPFASWTSWSNGRRHPSYPYRLWQERPVHSKPQRHSLLARTQTHWSLQQKGRQLEQGLGFR